MCESQQFLVINMEKADFVVGKHDGQIKEDQSVEIIDVPSSSGSSGSTGATVTTQTTANPDDVYQQLVTDYQSLINTINGFYASLKDVGLLPPDDFDLNGSLGLAVLPKDAKFMTLMDPVFRDETKKQEFLTAAVKGTSNEASVKIQLNDYLFEGRYYGVYGVNILNVDKLITNWKTKYEQQYTKIEGDKTIERKIDYNVVASPAEDLQTQLRNIYLTGNSNEDKQSFNGKHKFN